jgi:hypothetical protein
MCVVVRVLSNEMAALPPGNLRRLASSLALLVTAGSIAKLSLGSLNPEWLGLGFAGILGAASVGLTRRSVVAQVLSRGAAWVVFAPTAMFVLFQLLRGSHRVDVEHLIAASSAVSLLLAHPMLRTEEARRSFDPKVFRGWFLAGSTASVSLAYVAGGMAIALAAGHESFGAVLGFGALATSLLASAIAVVRMRGWGILLGAFTAACLAVSALFVRREGELALSLLLFAVPTFLLHLAPIALARLGFGSSTGAPASSEPTPLRIEDGLGGTRVRIADDLLDEDLLDVPAPRTKAMASLR